jgi:hypothetical protein
MRGARFWIRGFAERLAAGESMTLLCSSACVDPARCHRTLLKALLEREAKSIAGPTPDAPSPTRGVIRRAKGR